MQMQWQVVVSEKCGNGGDRERGRGWQVWVWVSGGGPKGNRTGTIKGRGSKRKEENSGAGKVGR